jgi:hypothetical protein
LPRDGIKTVTLKKRLRLYSHLKISHPIKARSSLLRLSIILLLSLIPMISYSADVMPSERANKAVQQVENSQRDALKSDEKTDNVDGFCVVATFSYLVDWVARAIRRIENEHPKSINTPKKALFTPEPSPETIMEEPKVTLDLTMPKIKHEGTMAIDKGQEMNFPDMFSAQAKKPYSKEAPSSSFGGRILMDDAELESLEQYRLNNVGAAVRGAEVSLEFKTN